MDKKLIPQGPQTMTVPGSRQSPYNVQHTMDTDNVLPSIGQGCPTQLQGEALDKYDLEALGQLAEQQPAE